MNVFGLCAGRHEMPVREYIFDLIEDITDLEAMWRVAGEKLKGMDDVTIYVTGLTPALVTVINYCNLNGVELTLMHFNPMTGGYFTQEVMRVDRL